MKKIYILTACMMLFLFVFTACGGSDKKEAPSSGKMYDTGLELATSISELSKNEMYVEASLPMREDFMLEMVSSIADMDYSQPEHVYRVKNMDEVISSAMAFVMEVDMDAFSDVIQKYLEARFVNAISTYITGQRTSATAIALSSIFVMETSFTDASVKDYEVYIYTYKDAYPVMVCFVPGKDGAVAATAGYILVDDYIGADGDALSEDISFAMLNIKLEEVFKQ
ncbi:MAG: hypothetical protein K2G45_10075 [Lachnospiraceae bacterium]|nr:hypothetical protein [Lachnospiraceae bacterium]